MKFNLQLLKPCLTSLADTHDLLILLFCETFFPVCMQASHSADQPKANSKACYIKRFIGTCNKHKIWLIKGKADESRLLSCHLMF